MSYIDPEPWARAAWESDLPTPEVPAGEETLFTPKTERVRDRFIAHSMKTSSALTTVELAGEAFDRWLATELQKARAEVAGNDPSDHSLLCDSTEWSEDGPEGDSGLPCDCYLSRAGGGPLSALRNHR